MLPTINQLVRKGRSKTEKKVKTRAFRVILTGPKPGHPDLPTRQFEVDGQPAASRRLHASEDRNPEEAELGAP